MDRNKYRPQISEDGKVRGLGSFGTLNEALAAQLKARIARDEKYIAQAQAVVDECKAKLQELTS